MLLTPTQPGSGMSCYDRKQQRELTLNIISGDAVRLVSLAEERDDRLRKICVVYWRGLKFVYDGL